MINRKHLSRCRRISGARQRTLDGFPRVQRGPARKWPGRSLLAAFCLLITSALALLGCGHATVPCPTPTAELDRLRNETDRLREEAEAKAAEEEALGARRDDAAQRVEAARARLDSLRVGRKH